MTTRICLINQKGGCGKSSTCFHLAGAYAQMGLRVLLIDADPQGSLSQGFLGSATVEAMPAESTLAAIFDDRVFVDAGQLIVATPVPGISLVVANQHLAPHNVPSPEFSGMKQHAIRSLLDDTTDFDLVLMDCPPNLYLCSWAAMVAADHVVIPVPPEDFGTQGLRVVHQAIEHARRLNPGLRRLGHLITRFDSRLLVHQSYAARLKSMYSSNLTETVIPEAAAFKVALSCRQPVGIYGPRSQAAQLTSQLAHEILDRVRGKLARLQVA